MSGSCFNCQFEMSFKERPPRKEECPSCGADVHACKNCQFYDDKVYNECRETSADVVREKERANFCDYFIFSGNSSQSVSKESLLSAAEALFKK